MKFSGRKIYKGTAQGEALVTANNISFFGGIDPESGVVVEKGHELEGMCIAGRVLVFPTGKGSTVGSYTIYRLKEGGVAPCAIINAECETITAVGCIIAEIPCVDQIDINPLRSGMILAVNGDEGSVEVISEGSPGGKKRTDFPFPQPNSGPGPGLALFLHNFWTPAGFSLKRIIQDRRECF